MKMPKISKNDNFTAFTGCDPIITEASTQDFKDPGLALKDTMVVLKRQTNANIQPVTIWDFIDSLRLFSILGENKHDKSESDQELRKRGQESQPKTVGHPILVGVA